MSDYDELAHRAERGELRVKPGTATLRGEAAAAHGRKLLMDATEAETIEDARAVALNPDRD
jgi:hypothetical protein